jgi:DNA-nicking Smr family endonuclease
MSKDKRDDSGPDSFRAAVGDVQPIAQDRVAPYRKRRKAEPLNLPVGDEEQEQLADLAIETPEFLEYQRPGVQHRVYRDLRRGVIEPEATLDLHGLRVREARQAIARFMQQNTDRGRRCVRVVHGKGRGSDHRQPILKQKTNQWLRQIDQVLAFCSAPRWDGGSGATYVLLSRKYRLDI